MSGIESAKRVPDPQAAAETATETGTHRGDAPIADPRDGAAAPQSAATGASNVSPDLMSATDRYALVMPYFERM